MAEMNLKILRDNEVDQKIVDCQLEGHVQQVAFSTYHHALTQVCFTCKHVRTSISKEDLK